MRASVVMAVAAVAVVGGVAVYLLRPAERPMEPSRPADVAAPAPRAEASAAAPVAPGPAPAARPAAPAPVARPPVPAAPTMGRLRIESDVPGAIVFLDRRSVGTAPVTIPDVAPGSHRINVSVDGYEAYAENIDVEPGDRTITVRFKEVRLDVRAAAAHKHGIGSCQGELEATPAALTYTAADGKDSFSVPLSDIASFDLDYLAKNLRLRVQGGRTYNFTEVGGNLDKLAYFQQDVEKVRKRLAAQ